MTKHDPRAEHEAEQGPAPGTGAGGVAADLMPPAGKKRRKSFFLRGLVTVLPPVLTIFILFTVVRFADTYVTGPINSVIYWSLEENALGWKILAKLGIDPLDPAFVDADALPDELRRSLEENGRNSDAFRRDLEIARAPHLGWFFDLEDLWIDPEKLRSEVKKDVHPLIGVLLSVLVVLTLGYFTSGFLGRRALASFDKYAHQVPIIRAVYPYTKQLVEFLLSEKELRLETVVAAPYPSPGLWSIAFVTSGGLKTIRERTGGRYVSVFVPSSPMPMTGYTVFIEADRLIPLPISVDEALRITVSAGVLIPPHENVEALEGSLLDSLAAAREEPMEESLARHGGERPPRTPGAARAQRRRTKGGGQEETGGPAAPEGRDGPAGGEG